MKKILEKPLFFMAVMVLPAPIQAAPVLEEVFVAAQKRQESLQDVPISIAAFDQSNLEKLGIHDIAIGGDRGRLRVSVWGSNLLDEEYLIDNVRQDSFETLGLLELATFGDPRTYGITLEYAYR